MVTKYLIFIPVMLIEEREQSFTNLLKIFQINQYIPEFNLLKSRIFPFKTEPALHSNFDKNFGWVDFGEKKNKFLKNFVKKYFCGFCK